MKHENPARNVRRVLVVVKKPTYQTDILEQQDPRLSRLLAEGNEAAVRMKQAYDEHSATLDTVRRELSARDIEYKCIGRGELHNELNDTDLVITVGGDGSFLDASHSLRDVPLFGVNSAPSSSHGHWCLATEKNFASVLDEIISGARQTTPLMRLSVVLNGKELPEPVLNEILICHSCPAGTSRYLLQVGNKREDQRSSGILIGPACGSTGFMRSAGGTVLSATSRQFQFLVREPCIRPGEKWELTRGILDGETELRLMSIMTAAKLYVDGSGISYDIPRGDEVTVKPGPDLLAFVNPDINNRYQ